MKKFITLLIIHFLIGQIFLILPVIYAQNADDFYQQAKNAQSDNEKIDLLKKALQQNPRHSEAYLELGQVYLRLSRYKDAEDALTQAVIQGSGNLMTFIYLGDAYQKMGQPKDATSAYESAIKKDPKNPTAHFRLIELYLQANNYDEALKRAQDGLKNLGLGNADLWYYTGESYRGKGQISDAKTYYQAALKYNKTHARALAALAGLENLTKIVSIENELEQAINANNTDLAIQKINEIKRLDRNYPNISKWNSEIAKIYFLQGNAALQKGDKVSALTSYQLAENYNKNYPGLQSAINRIKNETDQQAQLVNEYENGLQAYNRKQWRTAVIHLSRLRNIDPNYKNTASLIRIAQQELDKENPVRTEEKITTRPAVISDDIQNKLQSLYEEGVKRTEKGLWPAAIVKFDSALQIKPDFIDAQAMKAYAQGSLALDQKKWNEAQQFFAQAERLNSSNLQFVAANFYAQARLDSSQGRIVDAIEKLQNVQKLGFNFRDTRELLATASRTEEPETVETTRSTFKTLIPYVAIGLFVILLLAVLSLRKKAVPARTRSQVKQTPSAPGTPPKQFRPSEEVQTLVKTPRLSGSKSKGQGFNVDSDTASEDVAVASPASIDEEATRIMSSAAASPKWLQNRYEIKSQIGKGAMGCVYKAYDHRLKRTIVLKEIRMDIGLEPAEYDKLKERFEREALSAARLNHNNIVTVFDIIEDGNKVYIAMEYIDGVNLLARLREKKVIPPNDAVEITMQACQALDFAHRAKIVHRDIKPSNIMLVETGGMRQIKIVDFGVAKMSDSSTLTQAGSSLGTPSYMSPEQIEGKPIDGRSDIFSLGVVFYEMITGERPFKGENLASIIVKIIQAQPRRVSELKKDLPAELENVILKMLEKDPEKRYQTGQEVIEALKKVYS
ncbi:protein kinase [candidate division KSB1 bacterium]|nr:protein kinase [candidate division KSB1 bacterium]